MKKFMLFSITLLFLLGLAACGAEETSGDQDSDKNDAAETVTLVDDEESSDDSAGKGEPVEPDEDTVCTICNMKVYPKDHEMGVFTGQGITKDGETVFFDDIGCLLNYERETGETLEVSWIRDYETLEWVELDDATPVKTNLKSPMKWGYVFFDNEEKAEAFIKENSDLDSEQADWESLDKLAAERYQKKMEAMKNKPQDSDHSHQYHHDHDDEHDHDHAH